MKIPFLNNNKLIIDSIYYYIGKIIPGLIGFFSVPLFIRLFGTSVYGEYSILISTILLLSTFLTGWIGQTFMRFYSKRDKKTEYILFTYKILMLCNLIFIPIILTVLLFLNYSWYFSLLLVLIFFFLNIFSLLSIEKRTKLLSKKVVISDSIRAITFILIILLLYSLFKYRNDYELIILFSGSFIAYIVGSLFLKKSFFSITNISYIINKTINKVWLKEMFSYGLPIAFWMITAYLLNISDRYIIKYYLDYESVGLYSAVYDIFSKFMTFAFIPLMMAFQPIIIKLYNEGKKEKVNKYLKNAILLQIFAFLLFLCIVLVFKEKIVFDFLNLRSEQALSIVIPIFIGSFIWNLSMFVHKPLELKNKTIIMLYGVLIAFIVNLIGNLIFIPLYGILAASYTTLLGTGIYLIYIICLSVNFPKSKKILSL